MPGEYFGAILRDKKSAKEGTELYLKLVEAVELAYNKYVEAVYAWRQDDHENTWRRRIWCLKRF